MRCWPRSVEARWLLRHPSGPSYRLGPGLIALGEAARQGYPELPYAQDKMRELGTELGLECLASAVVGSEIVILAKSGAPVPLSSTAAIGQRVPLVPPLATVFFAWSHDGHREAAFARGTRRGSRSPTTTAAALRAVHERGYAIGLENPVRERLGRTLAAQLARGQLAAPEAARLRRRPDRRGLPADRARSRRRATGSAIWPRRSSTPAGGSASRSRSSASPARCAATTSTATASCCGRPPTRSPRPSTARARLGPTDRHAHA